MGRPSENEWNALQAPAPAFKRIKLFVKMNNVIQRRACHDDEGQPIQCGDYDLQPHRLNTATWAIFLIFLVEMAVTFLIAPHNGTLAIASMLYSAKCVLFLPCLKVLILGRERKKDSDRFWLWTKLLKKRSGCIFVLCDEAEIIKIFSGGVTGFLLPFS